MSGWGSTFYPPAPHSRCGTSEPDLRINSAPTGSGCVLYRCPPHHHAPPVPFPSRGLSLAALPGPHDPPSLLSVLKAFPSLLSPLEAKLAPHVYLPLNRASQPFPRQCPGAPSCPGPAGASRSLRLPVAARAAAARRRHVPALGSSSRSARPLCVRRAAHVGRIRSCVLGLLRGAVNCLAPPLPGPALKRASDP